MDSVFGIGVEFSVHSRAMPRAKLSTLLVLSLNSTSMANMSPLLPILPIRKNKWIDFHPLAQVRGMEARHLEGYVAVKDKGWDR
jgi:hypothetical protein